jgi:hypothetical protein
MPWWRVKASNQAMASRNEKPWLSVDDQLAQLVDRGMEISDPAKARDY